MKRRAAQLLDTLRKQGVHFSITDDDLSATGPVEVLTVSVRQQITYYEPELIGLLRERRAESPRWQPPAVPEPIPDCARTEAFFADGFRVQIRRTTSSRWEMWVTRGAAWHRRKDFATPYLDHARRTAEHWYGPPLGGWRAPEVER